LRNDAASRETALRDVRQTLEGIRRSDRGSPPRSRLVRVDWRRPWDEVRDLLVGSAPATADEFAIAVEAAATRATDLDSAITFQPAPSTPSTAIEISWEGASASRGPVARLGDDSFAFPLADDPYERGSVLDAANVQWDRLLERLRAAPDVALRIRSAPSVPWAYLVETLNLAIATGHTSVALDGIPGWFRLVVPETRDLEPPDHGRDLVPAVAIGLGAAFAIAFVAAVRLRRRDGRRRVA
jgi:hypothetical protein